MNNFTKIIRTLRKSTLIDIGKKLGIKNTEIDKDVLVESIEDVLEKNSKKNFTHTKLFQVGFPILTTLCGTLLGFYLGRVTDISNNELNKSILKVDTTTQKNINRLQQPLPNELKTKFLSIQLDTSGFGHYTKKIRETFRNKQSAIKEYNNKYFDSVIASEYQIYSSQNLAEVLNLYNGKLLELNIAVVDSIFNRDKRLQKLHFLWKIRVKIMLENNSSNLYYKIVHENNNNEYLKLTINEMAFRESGETTELKYEGWNSALDLCNKKVVITMSIQQSENNFQMMEGWSIENFKFKDEKNREYEIKMSGFQDYYDTIFFPRNFKSKYPNADLSPKAISIKYITGVLKCMSF